MGSFLGSANRLMSCGSVIFQVVRGYRGPKNPSHERPNLYVWLLFRQDAEEDVALDTEQLSLDTVFDLQTRLAEFQSAYQLSGASLKPERTRIYHNPTQDTYQLSATRALLGIETALHMMQHLTCGSQLCRVGVMRGTALDKTTTTTIAAV